MSNPKPETGKGRRRSAKAPLTYRGVRLLATGRRTRFSLEEIRQAVEAAIAKNADALAGKT
jgi:hypothetical protein